MARRDFLTNTYITVPDASGELEGVFSAGDAVTLEYGYRGAEPGRWVGFVTGTMRFKKDQLTVIASGPALALWSTTIKGTYMEESAEAIARHMILQAGLPVGDIQLPPVSIPRFPVASLPVTMAVRQLLHTLEKAFSEDMSKVDLWVNAEGAVNLGGQDETGEVPIIATGESLIEHLPTTKPYGVSTVEAFLLPTLTHSRLFRLQDTRLGVDAEVRALTVKHEIKSDQVRTFIGYGEEYGRF
jgi:hypothetical protein